MTFIIKMQLEIWQSAWGYMHAQYKEKKRKPNGEFISNQQF